MICRKCGKNIPDESVFCAHCGCDLRTSSPSPSQSSDDQIPLVYLINQVAKHKVATIISILIIGLAIGGYYGYKKHKVKKEAEAALVNELSRVMSIVGTYKSSDITLKLSADNTAKITYKKNGWNEVSYRGYWREKFDGNVIEIEFSSSLEDIYIGNKKHYYCSTLYLIGNSLWESLSAFRSQDYGASEYMTKE